MSLSACSWYSLPYGFIARFVLYVSGMLQKHESRLHQASVQVETVMSEIDIFVSPTSIITLDIKKLNDTTLVGNTGDIDNEIDFACSGGSKVPDFPRRCLSVVLRLHG